MYLKVIDIKNSEKRMTTNYEFFGYELLMVNISFNDIDATIPSYWRLTNVGNIPPLEIGVNTKSGEIDNITFFVKKTHLQSDLFARTKKNGVVKIETNIFRRVNDFVDIFSGYYVNIFQNTIECVFEHTISNGVQSISNNKFQIFTNVNNEIIGFSIIDVSNDDMEKLKRLLTSN